MSTMVKVNKVKTKARYTEIMLQMLKFIILDKL